MYNTQYCKVKYQKEKNAIFCEWKQFCRGDDYRNPFSYALEEINKHNITTWITDTRNGFENEEADTKWLLEELMPKMIESSIEKIIFIIKNDSLLIDEIRGQQKPLEEFFEVELVENLEYESIDVLSLFKEVLGEKINDFKLPPPSFELMKCEIITYDKEQNSLTIRVPVLEDWQNPFGTMQGGLVVGAIDNAVGPLSMLIAGANMTRSIETKYLKAITMDVGMIYVKAKLLEQKRRRLTFDVNVEDSQGEVYTRAKVVNFVLEEELIKKEKKC